MPDRAGQCEPPYSNLLTCPVRTGTFGTPWPRSTGVWFPAPVHHAKPRPPPLPATVTCTTLPPPFFDSREWLRRRLDLFQSASLSHPGLARRAPQVHAALGARGPVSSMLYHSLVTKPSVSSVAVRPEPASLPLGYSAGDRSVITLRTISNRSFIRLKHRHRSHRHPTSTKAPLVFVCTAALSPRPAPALFPPDKTPTQLTRGPLAVYWHPAAGRGRGVGGSDARARERRRRHAGRAAVDAALLVRPLGRLR